MSQAVKNEFIKWLDARYLDTISSTYLKMMDAAEDFSKANGLTELSIYDFSVPDYFEALSTDILQLLANTEITDENYLKMKAAFEHFSEFIAGDGKVSEEDEEKIREILREDDEKREAREQRLEEERLQREKEKEEMLRLFSSVTQVEEERDVQVEMPEESAEQIEAESIEEIPAEEIPAEDAEAAEETAQAEAEAFAPAADHIVTEEEASPEAAEEAVEVAAEEVPEAAAESAQEVTVIDETTEALGSEESENEKEFEAFLSTTGEGEDEDFDFEASLQKKPSEEIEDTASDEDLLSFFDALDIHPLDDEDDDEDVPVSAQEGVPVIEEEEVDEEAIITNFFNEIGVNREDFLSNAREFPAEEESTPVAEESESEAVSEAVPVESGVEAGIAAAGAAAVTEAAIDYAPLEETTETEVSEEEAAVEETPVEEEPAEEVPEEVSAVEETEAEDIEAVPAEVEDEDEDNTDFFDAMVTPEEKASLGYVAFHADHVSTINGSSVQAQAEPEAEEVAEENPEEAASEGATFPEGVAVTAATGVAAAAAVGTEAEDRGAEEAQDVEEVDIDKLASVDLDDLDFSAADDLFAAFATEIPAEPEVGYIPYKAERTSCDLTPAEETEAAPTENAAPKKRNAVHLAALRKKKRAAAKSQAAKAPAAAVTETAEGSAKTLGYVPFSSYPQAQTLENAQETLSLQAPEEEKALPAPEGAEAESATPDVIGMGGTIALGGVVSSMMLEDQRAGQELLEEPEKPLALDGETKEEAIPVGGTIAMGGDIALGEAEEGTGAPSYDMSPEAEVSEEFGETVVSVETAEKESRKTFGDFGRHDLPRPLSFSIGNRTPVEVEDWQDLYIKLINELIPLDRQKLSALLEYTSGEQIYRKPKMLRSGHIIESDLSERTILKNISAILKLCSVDSDSIRLMLEDTEE